MAAASPIPTEHRATAARWLPHARRALARTTLLIDARRQVPADLAAVHRFDQATAALGRATARALHPAGGEA